MIRELIEWVASCLPAPRIIKDRHGRTKYLSRYYLVGAPRHPDGGWPFDDSGAPREGTVWPNTTFGVYLHKFHRGDDERELHNHPWAWALSLVLVGGYIEERRTRNDTVTVRAVRAGDFNWITASTFHRVDLLDGEAWTLFVVGPKWSGWGFWNRDSGQFWPWREYFDAFRRRAA